MDSHGESSHAACESRSLKFVALSLWDATVAATFPGVYKRATSDQGENELAMKLVVRD